MTLIHIVVFSLAALFYSWLLPRRWRGWVLMTASVVAVYWLQPALPIRNLDFLLPTGTLILAVGIWFVIRQPDQNVEREDWLALALVVALVLGLSLTRYLAPEFRPTASRAPDVLAVALALLVVAGVGGLLGRVSRFGEGQRSLLLVILLVLALFVIFKTELLAEGLSGALRSLTGQQVELASVLDLGWLGFSYVAFRLIHTLRDRQTGRLPALSLREYMTYIIFFPAFTAGPIDRAERFVRDDRALAEMTGLAAPRFVEGGTRIVVGIFKKFVIADSLALLALNGVNAGQTTSTLGMWVLLYGYAFRLFFDFSGYSDIAIGIGRLYGISLPENFDRPYLKANLAAFWQSWHITLSQWARRYVFSPFSRAMLTRNLKLSPSLMAFIAQMVTMLVIGLWHGVAWNFVIWGAWHGVGLFIHKLWSDRTRKWYLGLKERPRLKQVWSITGTLITFHFVLLGWVWFALLDVEQAARVFLSLFGIGV